MERPDSLAQILELEEDPAFAESACPSTGVLVWPAIRNDVFRLLLGDLLYPTEALVSYTRRSRIGSAIASAARGAVHNRRHPPQRSDVLILSTGAGLIPRDGRSFNRHTDYFAELLGDRAWSMESLFGDAWPSLPRSNQCMQFLTGQRLTLPFRARISARPRHRAVVEPLVALAADRGRDRLGWHLDTQRRRSLVDAGARRLATYPLQAESSRSMLGRIQPRVVLVEEGCYGWRAVFNATAREEGVVVAEFQHGLVTHNHDAYNVATALASSAAYRLTQPHSFLAYGPWWLEQFNAPVVDRVAVGSPHRTEVLRSWDPEPVRRDIVVLGDGIETAASLERCRSLASRVPRDLRVVFRPHPLEAKDPSLAADAGLQIDTGPELYAALARAAAVVGESSTVLYEAIGLVPRIFTWDTAKSRFYLGDHPFERAASPGDLASQFARPGPVEIHDVDCWADGWESAFMAYIENAGRPPQILDEPRRIN